MIRVCFIFAFAFNLYEIVNLYQLIGIEPCFIACVSLMNLAFVLQAQSFTNQYFSLNGTKMTLKESVSL